VWSLLALSLLAQASAQCLVRCELYFREGCPQTDVEVCGACFMNYVGELEGNTNCTLVLPCVAAKTCSGHGFCRTDQSCGCDPAWFGADCSLPINAGSWSDANLGGVIIAWLLIGPILAGCVFLCFKAHEEGKLDDCTDSFTSFWKNCFASRPAPASPTPVSPPTTHGAHPPHGGAHKDAHPPHGAARDTAVTIHHTPGGVEMGRRQSSDGLLIWSPDNPYRDDNSDPDNADALIQQVLDIVPQTSSEEARAALRRHGWNVGAALPSVMK